MDLPTPQDLRERRNALGLTQSALAEAAGVSKRYVYSASEELEARGFVTVNDHVTPTTIRANPPGEVVDRLANDAQSMRPALEARFSRAETATEPFEVVKSRVTVVKRIRRAVGEATEEVTVITKSFEYFDAVESAFAEAVETVPVDEGGERRQDERELGYTVPENLDTFDEFGAPLGVGKESDVYEVRSYKPLALKYHREGYTQFREVQKEREYTSDKEHVSWFYTARKAAEHEHEVLETLYPDVAVPQPIDGNRHAIVMEKFPGVELANAKLDPGQATGVLDLILREIAAAHDAGFVHADVSEYNVAVSEDGIVLFDWPQAVATDHENAAEFLRRDIENVAGYMKRKYPNAVPEIDPGAVAERVREGAFESVEAGAV